MGWFGFLFIRSFLLFGFFFLFFLRIFVVYFARERLHKELLSGLYEKYCHLQMITFFPILQIIDSEVTKQHNCFFFLPFDLGKSYLSIHGNDFSYLSFEFPLTCRAHVAEMMHMKWQCQKQLLTDACCAVITLSISWQPFRICGL